MTNPKINIAAETAVGDFAPDIQNIFELVSHGPDTWVGQSPQYHWGRVFGGLVIAQSLWAATQTVNPDHYMHSMHAYFLLGGDPSEPIRYEVDRIRNGRSFTTRRIVARQSGGAIFNLACSFQRVEDGPQTQTANAPKGLVPPDIETVGISGAGVYRSEDVRGPERTGSQIWVRFPFDLGDDIRKQPCALAYLSDTNAMDAIATTHPDVDMAAERWSDPFMTASLDHAMWFQRYARADRWILIDSMGDGMVGTRGVSTGRMFTEDGLHVATIAQEGLIRPLRK